MDQNNFTQYFTKSGDPQVCQKLYDQAIQYITDDGFEIYAHQKEALLNHIAEMVKRDLSNTPIQVEDKSVFSQVSQESIDKARNMVNQLKHISEDEVYLLSTHFEVVKFN